jgi:hypothetical protein
MINVPLSIKISAIAIYLVSVCMLNQHIWLIYNFITSVNILNQQGSLGTSIFSIIVNILLLFTVFIKVSSNVSLAYHRVLNTFIVVFLMFFLLMSLQSFDNREWLLLAAASINVAALVFLFCINKKI